MKCIDLEFRDYFGQILLFLKTTTLRCRNEVILCKQLLFKVTVQVIET